MSHKTSDELLEIEAGSSVGRHESETGEWRGFRIETARSRAALFSHLNVRICIYSDIIVTNFDPIKYMGATYFIVTCGF